MSAVKMYYHYMQAHPRGYLIVGPLHLWRPRTNQSMQEHSITNPSTGPAKFMFFAVTGRVGGKGRNTTKYVANRMATKFNGRPNLPRVNGPLGISLAVNLATTRETRGNRYDMYNPRVLSDKIALNADVDPV